MKPLLILFCVVGTAFAYQGCIKSLSCHACLSDVNCAFHYSLKESECIYKESRPTLPFRIKEEKLCTGENAPLMVDNGTERIVRTSLPNENSKLESTFGNVPRSDNGKERRTQMPVEKVALPLGSAYDKHSLLDKDVNMGVGDGNAPSYSKDNPTSNKAAGKGSQQTSSMQQVANTSSEFRVQLAHHQCMTYVSIRSQLRKMKDNKTQQEKMYKRCIQLFK